jgi:hypothetical protein
MTLQKLIELGFGILLIIGSLVGIGYLILCPMELTEKQKESGWTGPNSREEAILARIAASAFLLFIIFLVVMNFKDLVISFF